MESLLCDRLLDSVLWRGAGRCGTDIILSPGGAEKKSGFRTMYKKLCSKKQPPGLGKANECGQLMGGTESYKDKRDEQHWLIFSVSCSHKNKHMWTRRFTHSRCAKDSEAHKSEINGTKKQKIKAWIRKLYSEIPRNCTFWEKTNSLTNYGQ